MVDRKLFKDVPWEPRDPRAILFKIAWRHLSGGARETPALEPWSRKLARKGLVDRIRLEDGAIAVSLTPAGRDLLLASMLEATTGRRLTGGAVQWTEARYVKRLLAAADAGEDA